MSSYFFDTSALIKRYHEEKGTAEVDEIFDSDSLIVISSLSVVESVSALKRKKNDGKLSEEDFENLLKEFFSDVLNRITTISLDDSFLKDAIGFVIKNDLRTLDSIQLSFAANMKSFREDIIFVCADKNLAKVAKSKGINVLNPGEK